jgi:hypothetical protein
MRPEETRNITVEWLQRHRIYYDELYCWPGSFSDPKRNDYNEAVRWKARIIQALRNRQGIQIYVDSHRKLAADIARAAGPGIAGLGIY